MTLASATIQISGYKTFLFSLFSKEFVKVTPMCFFFFVFGNHHESCYFSTYYLSIALYKIMSFNLHSHPRSYPCFRADEP